MFVGKRKCFKKKKAQKNKRKVFVLATKTKKYMWNNVTKKKKCSLYF